MAVQQAARVATVSASKAPIFIGGATGPRPALAGRNHPLAIARVATVIELGEQLGWLDASCHRDCPEATEEQLSAFHSARYIAALRCADATQRTDAALRARHNLGNFENPVFPGVFRQAARAVGGSILAADLAVAGWRPFHPAGGTHHGQADRASGFCYFNDPVFAVRRLLERGPARVVCIDLDAHHGDGVESAFATEPRVRAVSLHEAGRWPYTGGAAGRGAGGAFNLPVPTCLNDSEFEWLIDEAILPLAVEFRPEALVLICGTDALAGDPLTSMRLSNVALWKAVQRLGEVADATVVLGGGGYNPWTVARCWTGLWGRLSGREIPASLPPEARKLLADLACDLIDEEEVLPEWTTTLADEPTHGRIRPEVRRLAGVVARAAEQRQRGRR